MRKQESQAWLIVGVFFVTWFLIWGGGLNTSAVFFPPVLKYFGWSRAKLSAGFAIGALSAGFSGPLVGWLVDRIDVRKVMIAGVTMVSLGYLALSRTQTYGEFMACNVVIGAGVVASTGIPTSLVIANWFKEQRGLAMGISLAGASIGGAAMTVVANHVITTAGWRAGYVTIALPMALISIPLLILFVRTRPGSEPQPQHHESPPVVELPGLEVKEALMTRSLWLITIVNFLGACLWTGLGQHFVAYLIGLGYSATFSARAISAALVFTTVGSLLSGPMADRLNARWTLACSWILTGVAVLALIAATNAGALGVYVVLAGIVGGANGVLMPLLMLESLGIKRFGSLMGISGIFSTLGYAVGPVATGRIFDVTGSYRLALWLFVAISVICALSVLACRPFEREQERRSKTPIAA